MLTTETNARFLRLAKAIQNKRRRARDCMAAYFKHVTIIYCADYSVYIRGEHFHQFMIDYGNPSFFLRDRVVLFFFFASVLLC